MESLEFNQFQPGDVLGNKYRIERELGAGGFGRVYAAHHVDLGMRVAIKVRRVRGRDDHLWREAKAAAQLRSPYSVRVFDIARLTDGTPYLVMELLEGQSLRQYLKRHRQVSPGLARRWFLELCAALEEAHELNQVHRDIKPSNLFLVEQPHAPPQLKLLDFGLAKSLKGSSASTLTDSGIVVGSPAYMSPEQVRGTEVTRQTDIWSAGVVLYEMLTGRRPFDASSNAGTLAAIAADPAPPLHEIAPQLPRQFDAVIARCLRKRPSERYSSAAVLASELGKREGLSTQTDANMSTSISLSSTQTKDERQSRPRLHLGPALVAAACSIVLCGAAAFVLDGPQPEERAAGTPGTERPALFATQYRGPGRGDPSGVQGVERNAEDVPPGAVSTSGVAVAPAPETTAPKRAPANPQRHVRLMRPPRTRAPAGPAPAASTVSEPNLVGLFKEPDF